MIPERLLTTNLMMRPFAEGDGPAVFDYWSSDPGWERFNESVPEGFTPEDANDFVAEMRSRNRSESPSWALVYDDVVVGVVSLTFSWGHQSATLGYGIHAELRGRSLCAEAAMKILSCAFAEYPDLHTIQAHTDSGNSRSIRVLRKLGFSEVHDPGDRPSGDASALQGRTFRLCRTEWSAQDDHVSDNQKDS